MLEKEKTKYMISMCRDIKNERDWEGGYNWASTPYFFLGCGCGFLFACIGVIVTIWWLT